MVKSEVYLIIKNAVVQLKSLITGVTIFIPYIGYNLY
mgnify:CR=1 FL=1